MITFGKFVTHFSCEGIGHNMDRCIHWQRQSCQSINQFAPIQTSILPKVLGLQQAEYVMGGGELAGDSIDEA